MTERRKEWRAGACGAGWSNSRTNEGKNKEKSEDGHAKSLLREHQCDKRAWFSQRNTVACRRTENLEQSGFKEQTVQHEISNLKR